MNVNRINCVKLPGLFACICVCVCVHVYMHAYACVYMRMCVSCPVLIFVALRAVNVIAAQSSMTSYLIITT